MRVIIIGAGRGRRLMPSTADQPKCFAKVGGRRIIEWALQAFADNGIEKICFIGGYRVQEVERIYPDFTFRYNRDWENNNILESLMHAEDLMSQPFICCYSDTLFTSGLIRGLISSAGDISLSVDRSWLERYRHRTDHPPTDAEKVTVEDGYINRIHRDIPSTRAHGEYTGIAKFSEAGAEALKDNYRRCKRRCSGRPFREASVFEKAYLIHLFQEMIDEGVRLNHVDSAGDYLKVDPQQDYDFANKIWPVRTVTGKPSRK